MEEANNDMLSRDFLATTKSLKTTINPNIHHKRKQQQ